MLGNVPFEAGESFVFESGGGGGWGSPLERSAELVTEDVANGFVSRKAAEDVYGVVLTESGQIDAERTQERRARMSA
jgi:N-methylhydantoinase B/oxoprolinase/acetone carboxylase alpha subunit